MGTISIPSGDLLITTGGIAGAITLSTTSLALGAVTVSGALSLQVNTMSAAAVLSDGTRLPAGPYVELAGTNLTVALGTGTGAPSLSGSFAIESVHDGSGNPTLLLAATGVNVNLGGSLNGVVTGASGILVVLPGASGGLAGQLSGTVDLSGLLPSGIDLSGTFGFAINETGQAVAESVTVGGQAVSINAPAGPYLQISATGARLSVLGETLSGTFSIQRQTVGSSTTTVIVASGVAMSLGVGGATFVSLSGGSGEIEITGGGLAGTLSGTVATSIPGVSLTATFTLVLNTTGASVTLPSGTVVGAGPLIELTASSITATILGQSVTGTLAFTRDSTGTVQLTITNLAMTLGTASLGVSISQTSTQIGAADDRLRRRQRPDRGHDRVPRPAQPDQLRRRHPRRGHGQPRLAHRPARHAERRRHRRHPGERHHPRPVAVRCVHAGQDDRCRSGRHPAHLR